jgi:hypothetical protein
VGNFHFLIDEWTRHRLDAIEKKPIMTFAKLLELAARVMF